MPREIGWSIEANLLYQIKQLLKRIQGIVSSNASSGGDVPTFPTITQNGKFIAGGYGQIQAVFANNYLRYMIYLPQLNKRYPDVNRSYKCFSDFIQPGTFVDSTSHTVSDLEMVWGASGTLTLSATSGFTNITFSDLMYVMIGTGTFSLSSAGTNQTINFPELIAIQATLGISSTGTNVSLNFPKLEAVTGVINQSSGALSSVYFPELIYCLGFTDSTSAPITTYNFPKLRQISLGANFAISGTKSSLTSILLPSIEYFSGTLTLPTVSPQLTTFTFGSSLKFFNSNFVTTSNSLNQASVDNILISLAALDGTNGTIVYQNRTITITGGSASPSTAGYNAYNILLGRGCTLMTN